MNCQKVRALLPHVLDEGVSTKLMARIQVHLSSCQECSDNWNLLIKSWHQAKNYPVPSLDNRFTASVMDKVCAVQTEQGLVYQKSEGSFFVRFRLQLIAAVAAALVVILSICILSIEDKPDFSAIDAEIVQNLTLYENQEFFQNLELLSDYEIIVNLDKVR